ncbi:MAG TPA: hypothetical protein VK832_06490 [Burkholderiaceae bacterium]|jgi:hypothetical protein|nr:hypothetical protein [Burkholderiaceae bacterium]
MLACRHSLSRKKIAEAAIALFCLFTSITSIAAPERIFYPGTASVTDTRAGYYVKLLDLALRKTGIQYELRPNEMPMASPRTIQKIASNDGLDVTWGPTTRELEQALLPVRIPIDKGVLGLRLFLIKKRDRSLFENIHTLAQLQLLAAGQQRDWSDTEILRANGMKVVGADIYEQMFQMLAADRFQYFPRGVAEIWGEEKSHTDLGLEVEQHLALRYPACSYFFVSKGNAKLAQSIEQGLRIAMRDGSFEKLFQQYNGDYIKLAHLNTRTVFELNNPLNPNASQCGSVNIGHL